MISHSNKQTGGDEFHETLKRYNFRPEKGHVEARDDNYKWVVDSPASWQEPKQPWTCVVEDAEHYTVYKDGFPVTEGHLLFVPKQDIPNQIYQCYKAACKQGNEWLQSGYCDAYNIGQNVGEAAGQTVMWPHIHLIPRRKGDMEDPRGGVRHVIPQRGNYKNEY